MLRDRSLIPLSRDHHHALALCLRIKRRLDGNPASGGFPEQAAEVGVAFDREIGAHFDVEERILFPALAGKPEVSGLIAQLQVEHEHLRRLVERLRSTSERKVLEEFAVLLEEHIRKEERQLFEAAQGLLSREELDQLGPAISPA